MSTLVLVHGAGHHGGVWDGVRRHLRHPSIAVDLPGRRAQPGDLVSLTIDEAAASAARAVEAAASVVLVGHSSGGIVLPALAARLGPRVARLVFVAGLSAPEGETVAATVLPDRADAIAAQLTAFREQFGGHRLGDGAGRLAMSIESLNLMSQPVTWAGVAPDLPRTFVRCLRDPIQPRDLQRRLARNCGTDDVIDIDTGHTPALDDPPALAAVLDGLADRVSSDPTGA